MTKFDVIMFAVIVLAFGTIVAYGAPKFQKSWNDQADAIEKKIDSCKQYCDSKASEVPEKCLLPNGGFIPSYYHACEGQMIEE